MPKFTYTAKDTQGKSIDGALEVEDRQAVISRLQSMGYFPVKITDVTPREKFSLATIRSRVSTGDMVAFNRQLADLVAAGVPLVKALAIILSQIQAPTLREVVTDISKNVQSGDTLAQALQRHPKVFSPLNVALVRAGESGGMLDDVLQRMADYSESEANLKGKVISSLAYPVVMVAAGSIVIMILLTVVIPKITEVYSDLGQTLPLITRQLIFVTDSLVALRYVLPLMAIVAIFLMRMFLKSTEGRAIFDRVLLKIPVFGTVVHRREIAQFCRTLGNLVKNGVPILKALEITQEVISNVVIREEVAKLPVAISQGGAMAETLAGNPLFPSIMVSMIAVGEETGQLDRVLLRISDTYEAQVDRSLKTLTSMLEPLIIVALGIVVGVIVIAMMLPIMTMDPTGGG